MTRRVQPLVYLCLLVLLAPLVGACGGGASPEATPRAAVTPTEARQANETTSDGTTVPEPTDEPVVPEPTEASPPSNGRNAQQQPPESRPPVAGKVMYASNNAKVGVNMRAKAGADAPLVLTIPYASAVQVADTAPLKDRQGRTWQQVQYGGKQGYVLAELLVARRSDVGKRQAGQQTSPPQPQPPAKQEPKETAKPLPPAQLGRVVGVVTDSTTGEPVAGAWVYAGQTMGRTDSSGRYSFDRAATNHGLTVMAPGYAKYESVSADGTVALKPFEARGVYVPLYVSYRYKDRQEQVFRMIEKTGLNTIVIDLKSDRGYTWDSDVPLAKQVGANIADLSLRQFTDEAHRRGIYVIGRLTCFKDSLLPEKRPELAIHDPKGKLWLDYGEEAYADPFDKRAWQYLADLAVEAAERGVDEIQWDYVRFPVDGDLSTARYDGESTPESRVEQITGFVEYSESRLRPAKAFISADIFGRTVWHKSEGGLGQRLENIAEHVDFVSPMIYPSGFDSGSGGYDVPTKNSYGIIRQSMQKANARLEGMPTKVRPWLQAFVDYAYDVPYGPAQHIEQIKAAEEFGSSGWLFWNATGTYKIESFRGVR